MIGLSLGMGLAVGNSGSSESRLIQGTPSATLRNNFSGWLGCSFVIDSAITVTALSRWALVANTGSHTVKLTTNAGVLIASASVDCSSVSADRWVDVSIAPVELAAGTYRLGSEEVSAGDSWYDSGAMTAVAGATITSAYSSAAVYPNVDQTPGACFIPVSLRFRR